MKKLTKAQYAALLKKAPPQDSPKFLTFLRTHNKVVWEDSNWLVIENVKYHTKRTPWYTAFAIDNNAPYFDLYSLAPDFGLWEWLKKAHSKQTVRGRFHIHLIKRS